MAIEQPPCLPPITLCLTIGNRPQELRQTLLSLQAHASFENIIAVNDFRDEPSNAVFRELCPTGTLVLLDERVGHHRAADAMYQHIQTPYVFHCEDDWFFDTAPDFSAAIKFLEDPHTSVVCFRKALDVLRDKPSGLKPSTHLFQETPGLRLDHLHPQWHGFTFNPHLSKLALWEKLGGFTRFASEKEISASFRADKRFVVFTEPGSCRHIGDGVSVSGSNHKSLFKRFKLWLRSKR
jgi:hypothetical protein